MRTSDQPLRLLWLAGSLAEGQLKANWTNVKCLFLDIRPAALDSVISNLGRSLTMLSIITHVFYASAVKKLADADLPCLRALYLGRGIDVRGMAELVCGRWPNMTDLVLHDSCLGGDALQPFSQAHWTQLQTLSLVRCQVNSAAMVHLASAQLPCLTSLSLSFNKLDCPAIEHLTGGHCTQLLRLDLAACNLGRETADMLSGASWPLLQQLQLQHNQLSYGAMSPLMQANWPCLQQLNLNDTGVCLNEGPHLVHGRRPRLRKLRASGCTSRIYLQGALLGN